MSGGNQFLLDKYFQWGWLSRSYFDGKKYCQPYSAEDRLRAGELLYFDYLIWKRGIKLTGRYETLKVDSAFIKDKGISTAHAAERFRRALKAISKPSMPIVYKIVLEETEIMPQKTLKAREKLYFNDEIKGLLCRGLDELIAFYKRILL